ncbi:SseB family protein [Actinomadura sp. 21ATH]|uniref:SseB family protein n=1 Tax=Actinomadura sp. 21ATH TaxID=1735444 RepID=UPI0035C064FC
MKQGVATVADAWRPTSELERRLQEAVRSGDQEAYFRLLAGSELVIPVPPAQADEVLADQARPSWPVQEEDGRTHVLAYTSAAAMRDCLGPAYRHYLRLRFTDLAETWPDARWWLAVDVPMPGTGGAVLPIEARLPAWFIRQVADGDARPPMAGRRTPDAPDHGVQPPVSAYPQAQAPAYGGAPQQPSANSTGPFPAAAPQPSSNATGPLPADPPQPPPNAIGPLPADSSRPSPNAAGPLPAGPSQPPPSPNATGALPAGAPEPAPNATGPLPGGPPQQPPNAAGPPPAGPPQHPHEAPAPGGAHPYQDASPGGAPYPPSDATGALPGAPRHEHETPGVPEPAAPGDPRLPHQPPADFGGPPPVQDVPPGIPDHGLGAPQPQPLQDAPPNVPDHGLGAPQAPGDFQGPPSAGPQPVQDGPSPLPDNGPGGPQPPADFQGPGATGPRPVQDAPANLPDNGPGAAQPQPLQDAPPNVPDHGPGGPQVPSDERGAVPGAPQPFPEAPPNAAGAGAGDPSVTASDLPAVPGVPDGPPPDATRGMPLPSAPHDDRPGRHAASQAQPDTDVPVAPRPPADGGSRPPEGGVAAALGADTSTPPKADVTRLDNPAPPDEPAQWEELHGQHKELPRKEERRPEFQPANDVERALLRAAANNDHDLFLQSLADAEVLLPVPEEMDYTLRPGRPGFPWQTREVDGTTVIPVFTSPERLVEAAATTGAGTDFIKLPFTVVLRYWPGDGRALAINSGSPAGGTILAEQLPGLATWADQRAARRMSDGFEPQNDVEQRLFEAALRRDTDGFAQILLGSQVLVPAEQETPWGIAPDDPEFPWRPVPVQGTVAIQLFTSLKWMNEAIGSSRFVMPSLQEIAAAWPDAEWTLVLNPGTPIDATMPGEQVRSLAAAARTAEAPAPPAPAAPPAPPAPAPPTPTEPIRADEPAAPAPEPASAPVAGPVPERPEPAPERPADAEFEPGNRIDQELYEAALAGDSDAFLRVLLAANVLVPIPEDAPLEVTPVQREFRWEAALRGEHAVQVFTSLVRLREVLPESRFVYADFRELIGSWPHADWAMLLNPGTRIGASLRGDQVLALSEWAVRVGLVQPRPEVPTPPPSQRPAPAPAADATVTDLPPVPPQDDRPAPGLVAEPHLEPEAEPETRPESAEPLRHMRPPDRPEPVAPLPEPDGDRVAQPTIMQKVVPHHHVAWYLEQGYDRVGGFVHPTSDVAELQTPMQLYETLGLLYEDAPFQPGDEGVHVIRWPAYCPSLYRVPFGGQTEEELAAWGESGWVIERAPFHGSGFAPGSAGSIREYKVDSVRLPFGAEMYYLALDGTERFVAMYDPDRLAWLRPETGGGRQDDWDGQEVAK